MDENQVKSISEVGDIGFIAFYGHTFAAARGIKSTWSWHFSISTIPNIRPSTNFQKYAEPDIINGTLKTECIQIGRAHV